MTCQDDPATFESYAAAHSTFRDVLYDGATGRALAPEDLTRCLKLFTILDPDQTPKLTDEVTQKLIPLLVWLNEAGDQSLGSVPKLADAARTLLEKLASTTVAQPRSPMEAAIAKKLSTTAAGKEMTQRFVRDIPDLVVPTNDNKRQLKTAVDADIMQAFKAIATLNGKSSETLLRDIVVAVVAQYQELDPSRTAVAVSTKRARSTAPKKRFEYSHN